MRLRVDRANIRTLDCNEQAYETGAARAIADSVRMIQSRPCPSIALPSMIASKIASLAQRGLVLILVVASATSFADIGGAADPTRAAIRGQIAEFLAVHTRGLPGRVGLTIGHVDERLQLAPCSALEVFLPPGVRLWGKSRVGVKCLVSPGWTLYVSVHVRIHGSYLVAARSLAAGQVVQEDDLASREGDLSELPASTTLDPAQAVGRTLAYGLGPGQVLRKELLREAVAVQQGQNVRVFARGQGFTVSNEGRALNSATVGQLVQVRLVNGQLASGPALGEGAVELRY